MAITLNFPTLPSGNLPDSKKMRETRVDPAIVDETEGGYEITRPRFLRTPRRHWAVGYTEIPQADKDALNAFYDATMGGSRIFNWTDPSSGVVYQVRFKGDLAWTYAGRAHLRLWNLEFELRQA